MSIHRYAFSGDVSATDLNKQIPSGTASVVGVGLDEIDLNLTDDASLTDLTEFIQSLGGTFIASSPTTPLSRIAAAWQGRVLAQQNTPPVTPADGDRYLVGAVPTGAWVGRANEIAQWRAFGAGAWLFLPPKAGYQMFDVTAGRVVAFGDSWTSAPSVLQDVVHTLAADVTVSTVAPAWGDMYVAPAVVGGNGTNRLRVSMTAAPRASGNIARFRLVHRISGTDTQFGSPAGLVTTGSILIGNIAMSGETAGLAPGSYNVVVQAQLSAAGAVAVLPVTVPEQCGLVVRIQEVGP
jgi:hypothetical protein